MILAQYPALFPKQKKTDKEYEKKKGFSLEVQADNKYNWLRMIRTLAKDMNEPESAIYKKNYIHCLNWLGMIYNDNEVEKSKQKNIR